MTNEDLLLMILGDAKAIETELDKEPSADEFAAWMKTELTRLLQKGGYQVYDVTSFTGLAASWSDPPATYAIGLATENDTTTIIDQVTAIKADLENLPAGSYTDMWAVGITYSESELDLIEPYAADSANDAICGQAAPAGLGAIVVTVATLA